MNPKKTATRAEASTLCLSGMITPAVAGPHADRLSQCRQAALTPQERASPTQWISGALAAHPDVSGMARVCESQRQASDVAIARMFERLLGDACRNEAVGVIRNEGAIAFTTLGEVAGKQIFDAPEVTEVAGRVARELDQARLARMFEDSAQAAP